MVTGVAVLEWTRPGPGPEFGVHSLLTAQMRDAIGNADGIWVEPYSPTEGNAYHFVVDASGNFRPADSPRPDRDTGEPAVIRIGLETSGNAQTIPQAQWLMMKRLVRALRVDFAISWDRVFMRPEIEDRRPGA